jgi:hypothetical protein
VEWVLKARHTLPNFDQIVIIIKVFADNGNDLIVRLAGARGI